MQARTPTVAGSFYPANPRDLRGDLEGMLADSGVGVEGSVVGLLAPHAGYVFSGSVAASAYSLLRGKTYDAVIVVGPSHREPIDFSSVLVRGAYNTPLGDIPVHEALAADIAGYGASVRAGEEGHRTFGRSGEHSLEVQLPFLQVVLQQPVSIVPIVMGLQTPSTANDLGEAIARAAKERHVLLVASSDLSHYYTAEEAGTLDGMVQRAVKAFDVDQLWDHVRHGRGEACGVGPLAAVMHASRLLGADRAVPLKYATSGDVPYGDRQRVVGYLSAAFVRRGEEA